MRTPLAAAAAVCCVLAGPSTAPGEGAQDVVAHVSGLVTAADTGRPIGGAEIKLESRQHGANRIVRTDSSGRYEIAGLAPGPYVVRVSAAGYHSQVLGEDRPDGLRTEISARAGEHLELNAALRRYGAISGRVLDPFGDPLPGVSVVALERKSVDGLRRLIPAGGTLPSPLTDDLGRFRLYTLGPGEYVIVALAGPFTAQPPFNARNDTGGFLPTYYPSTPSAREAVPVTLAVGEQREGITIAMTRGRGARVSGTVVDSQGLPFARGLMSIVAVDAALAGALLVGRDQAGTDGGFTFSNVPPGEYVIQARSLGTTGAFTGEFGWLHVTVGDGDLSELLVRTSPGSTVKIRITVDSHDPVERQPRPGMVAIPMPIDLLTQPVLPTGSGSSQSVVRGDIEVTIRQIWGRQLIRGVPGELFLKSVTIDGRDVTDTPIEFRGQPVSADVILTTSAGRVIGRVLDADEKPAARCTVIVFSSDRALWTPRSRFVQTALTDGEGRARFTGLAPGSYLAVALESAESAGWTDPESLARWSGYATSLTVAAGEARNIQLTLTTPR